MWCAMKHEFFIGIGIKDIKILHKRRRPVESDAVVDVVEKSFAARHLKSALGDAQPIAFFEICNGMKESGAGFGASRFFCLAGDGDTEVAHGK